MRLITAIIRPSKLDDVKEVLHSSGVQGLTITNALGFGRQRGHTEVYRGAEYTIDFVPKIRIEIVVEESQVEQVVETLANAAHTGRIGDGKIWTTEVEAVVRVRTTERGPDAIS